MPYVFLAKEFDALNATKKQIVTQLIWNFSYDYLTIYRSYRSRLFCRKLGNSVAVSATAKQFSAGWLND